MADPSLAGISDDALGERYRSLMSAYDEACKLYDHEKAAVIHREFYAAEDELRKRRGADWRGTGLENLDIGQLLERFKSCAIAYDEADGSDETEHLYWDLDDVKEELKRRDGDQRRALFKFYEHPDIRVRAQAADATRNLAPLLSQHRAQNIDDEDWAPASGLDIAQAGLSAVFPNRTRKPDLLSGLSVEQLVERFVALTLQQYETQLNFEIARYNRLYGQVRGIVDQLKARPGDQRNALTALFTHRNPQVRLTAARATLACSPANARQVIQAIADSKDHPWAMDAGMCLRMLDDGMFKPT